MTTPNVDALNSPIYNPPISSLTMSLMDTMGPPSQEVVDHYTSLVNSLPTANPYAGMIENPRSCDIEAAKYGLNNLRNQVANKVTNAQATGNEPEWIPAAPGIYANIDESLKTLDDFQNHTDKLVANMPMIIGTAQSSAGFNMMSFNLPDPCGIFTAILGSLLAIGAALMKAIIDAIAAVIVAIEIALADMMRALAALMSWIKKLAALIAKEIAALIAALIALARLLMIELLAGLRIDPCLMSLFGSFASVAAMAALAKVPKI